MAKDEIPWTRTLGDDPSPLEAALRNGIARPIVLWGHPETGRGALVELAAAAAGVPLRRVEANEFESWDGFRDVSESGHFREVSLERFLTWGERADPSTYTVAPGEALLIKDLNRVPTRLVQAVFDQILDRRMLMNNPIPEGVRVLVTAQPPDRHRAVDLLGEDLAGAWQRSEDRASFKYPVFPLPGRVAMACEHWAVHPSVARFVAYGRKKGIAPEVIGFVEEEAARDRARAAAMLHAALIRKRDLFPQTASPRAFLELGALLAERRPYFSTRVVREALAQARSASEFQDWLHRHLEGWDGERWIEADASLTVRGEPAPGSVWLRHLREQVKAGASQVSLDDLITYSAFERRSVEVWATQELGDELGKALAQRVAIGEADVARLRG